MSDTARLVIELIEQGGGQPASGPGRIAPGGSPQGGPGGGGGAMPESAGEKLDGRKRPPQEPKQEVPASPRQPGEKPSVPGGRSPGQSPGRAPSQRRRREQSPVDILAQIADAAGVPRLGTFLRRGQRVADFIQQQREAREERLKPEAPQQQPSPKSTVTTAPDRPQQAPASRQPQAKPTEAPQAKPREAKPVERPEASQPAKPSEPAKVSTSKPIQTAAATTAAMTTAQHLAARAKALEGLPAGTEVGGFKAEDFKTKQIEGRFFTRGGVLRSPRQLARELPADVEIPGFQKPSRIIDSHVADSAGKVPTSRPKLEPIPRSRALVPVSKPAVEPGAAGGGSGPVSSSGALVPSSGGRSLVPTGSRALVPAGGGPLVPAAGRAIVPAVSGAGGAGAASAGILGSMSLGAVAGVAALAAAPIVIGAELQRQASKRQLHDIERLQAISPQIARAVARNEAARVQADIAVNRDVGDRLAQRAAAKGALGREVDELKTRLAAMSAPNWAAFENGLANGVAALNGIVGWTDKMTAPFLESLTILNQIGIRLGLLEDFVSKHLNEGDILTRAANTPHLEVGMELGGREDDFAIGRPGPFVAVMPGGRGGLDL